MFKGKDANNNDDDDNDDKDKDDPDKIDTDHKDDKGAEKQEKSAKGNYNALHTLFHSIPNRDRQRDVEEERRR